MASEWRKVSKLRDGVWYCTHKKANGHYCNQPAVWESRKNTGGGRCAEHGPKHGPKPPAKRKAFKRWHIEGDGDRICYVEGSTATVYPCAQTIVALLNAAGATLPTGRKANR